MLIMHCQDGVTCGKSRHIVSERNDCTLPWPFVLNYRYKILASFPDSFHDSILRKFHTASDECARPGNKAYRIPLYTQVYYCPSRGSWLKALKRNSRTCIPPHLSGRSEHLHLLTGTSSITWVDLLLLQWCGCREERNFPFTTSLIENQVDRVSKARVYPFSPFVWDVTDCVWAMLEFWFMTHKSLSLKILTSASNSGRTSVVLRHSCRHGTNMLDMLRILSIQAFIMTQ